MPSVSSAAASPRLVRRRPRGGERVPGTVGRLGVLPGTAENEGEVVERARLAAACPRSRARRRRQRGAGRWRWPSRPRCRGNPPSRCASGPACAWPSPGRRVPGQGEQADLLRFEQDQALPPRAHLRQGGPGGRSGDLDPPAEGAGDPVSLVGEGQVVVEQPSRRGSPVRFRVDGLRRGPRRTRGPGHGTCSGRGRAPRSGDSRAAPPAPDRLPRETGRRPWHGPRERRSCLPDAAPASGRAVAARLLSTGTKGRARPSCHGRWTAGRAAGTPGR